MEQVWSKFVWGNRRGCFWGDSRVEDVGFQPLQKSVENWGFVSFSGSEVEELEWFEAQYRALVKWRYF